MLEHLNFFNRVINELVAVDIKVNDEDKMLILWFQSHMIIIITTMLYGKNTLIIEEVTTTMLWKELRKWPNQDEQDTGSGLGLVVIDRERKVK